eukprot:1393389-Amorphochlora_amoeboformis.AAC.2
MASPTSVASLPSGDPRSIKQFDDVKSTASSKSTGSSSAGPSYQGSKRPFDNVDDGMSSASSKRWRNWGRCGCERDLIFLKKAEEVNVMHHGARKNMRSWENLANVLNGMDPAAVGERWRVKPAGLQRRWKDLKNEAEVLMQQDSGRASGATGGVAGAEWITIVCRLRDAETKNEERIASEREKAKNSIFEKDTKLKEEGRMLREASLGIARRNIGTTCSRNIGDSTKSSESTGQRRRSTKQSLQSFLSSFSGMEEKSSRSFAECRKFEIESRKQEIESIKGIVDTTAPIVLKNVGQVAIQCVDRFTVARAEADDKAIEFKKWQIQQQNELDERREKREAEREERREKREADRWNAQMAFMKLIMETLIK